MTGSAANGQATRVLEACRNRLGRIRVGEISTATGLDTRQVTRAFRVLIRRGLASRSWAGVFRLTPAGLEALNSGMEIQPGQPGPRVLDLPETSIRTRVWRALRLSRKGSIRELLTLASRGEEIEPEDTRKYLNTLVQAGFLTRMSHRGERGQTRYLLIRDTGPRAPQWDKRKRRVFDPNTEAIHELA